MNRKKQIKNKVIRYFRIFLAGISSIKKQVFFESFDGRQYSDNPRAISEKLHEKYPEYKIVWPLNANVSDRENMIPEYVKVVKRKSLSYFWNIERSFAYVTNEALTSHMYKRKGQFFIQTWHGDRAPKKVLYDAWAGGKRPFPVMDEFMTDLCVAGSQIGKNVYRDAFHYHGEVLMTGSPRNDRLVINSEAEIKKIRNKLGIDNDTKIMMYAPTYRDNIKGKEVMPVDLHRIIKLLEDRGEKWACFIRAHSHSAGISYEYSDKFIDMSQYFDMADLLLVTDLLITDYSSSAGDYILRNKPVILAMFDYDEYRNNCREFKFDIRNCGFVTAYNQAELEALICSDNQALFEDSCRKLYDYFEINETGHSSEDVCDRIDRFFREHYIN